MLAIKSVPVLFLMIICVSYCERRIQEGEDITRDRTYVVYLVKASLSDVKYDSWLCGGAIVSSEFVLTSAACVNDVDFLYVIAGYKQYVPDHEIDTDKCTSAKKKKVIYTCSPKGYNLKYGELDYWSFIDIALAKVESPFDFDDASYETLCSYKPSSIALNYDEKYQEAGTDALVFGWGHSDHWRKPNDTNNYNQPTLKYAPTLLLDKKACIDHYRDHINMSNVIKTYMICSLGKGNIDELGQPIQQNPPLENGCTRQQQKLMGFEGVSCELPSIEESYEEEDETRRHGTGSNHTANVTLSEVNEKRARRSGICQNDHGGPLVTWSGAKEVIIGVASVFKVSEDYECMGPYLYTSTRCTALFLDCILQTVFPTRRYLCDRPANERGYDTIERTISWKNHPAGFAENENIGRVGAKPKISLGLKYLTSNNQPPIAENTKYDSNNKFEAPIAYGTPTERDPESISGKDLPVNGRQQEAPKYEEYKQYEATKDPEIISFAHKERFKSSLTNQRFPVTGRYPVRAGNLKTLHNRMPAKMVVRPIRPLRN